MGSMWGIYSPVNWRIICEGKLKNDGREMLEVVAGYCDDYHTEETTLYILREHYDGIMQGAIQVVPHPYNDEQIELFYSGKKIEPIIRGDIYVY